MVDLASLAYMPPTGLFFSNRYGDFSLNVLPSGLVSLKQFMDLKEISMILKQRSVDLYGRSWFVNLLLLNQKIFALDLKKDIIVAEKMGNASLNLSFCRLPRSGIEDKQYKNLVSITSDVLLPQMHDRWSWSLNASGDFTVRSVRNHMDDVLLPKSDVPTRWVTMIDYLLGLISLLVAWRFSRSYVLYVTWL
ncbi:hypothetical protein Tco_1230966 [Tanacetum coccineum]